MVIDGNTLEAGARLETDVLIVGSGPAGLTLARELSNQPFNVLLVESGEFRQRRELKKLNEGDTSGDPYPNPRWGRSRQFGGTPNRWQIYIGPHNYGARYAPMDPVDFQTRDYLPNSGWPISREDLDPYYERAQVHCEIGPYRYDVGSWATGEHQPLPWKGGRLANSMFQFGGRDVWTERYEDVTQKARNMRVIIDGSVVELLTDDAGTRVTGVRVMNLKHESFFIQAKQVILAVGCIESTRLLLVSRDHHAEGLGNGHDVVGRYFMDHPQSYLNELRPKSKQVFQKAGLYDLRSMDNGKYGVMAKMTFTEEVMRREALQNICFVLFPRRDHFMSPAFQSFFTMLLTVIHAQRPTQLKHHLTTMLKGTPDLVQIGLWWLQGKAVYPYLAQGGWAERKDRAEIFDVFEIFSLLEQAPDPTNRITLSDQIDPNFEQKVHVHWQFTERDRESVARSRRLFDEEMKDSDFGMVNWHPDPYTSASSVHPCGGVRMSASPTTGVVNAQCQVHGVENLYISGSGVFPTSGYVNPTLTVVALAVRIADHVKAQYQHAPNVSSTAAPH